MSSVILTKKTGRYFETAFSSGCDGDFYDLIEYLLEGDVWSYLIDPYISRNDKMYACNNFYCTRLEGYNLLITDIYKLDHNDHDAIEPIIVNQNTAYGLVFAFNFMNANNITSFTITRERQGRYIFIASGVDSIVIDPDLGTIYNEMIPLITVDMNNALMDAQIQAKYHIHPIFDEPTQDHLRLFYNVFIKNLSRAEATARYADICKWLQEKSNDALTYNDIKVTNKGNRFRMEPIIQKKPDFISFTISTDSAIKFLQAWESRLRFCDSFTLVFLGQTLRFFEGEPMSVD